MGPYRGSTCCSRSPDRGNHRSAFDFIDSTVVEAHVSVPSYIIENMIEGNSYNFLIDNRI